MIHVVDVGSSDPVADYLCIRTELERYSPALLLMPELIALNKIDNNNVVSS